MESVQVTRDGRTNQFSVVLTQGTDTIRCMVTVAEDHSDDEKYRSALSKAKALAKALDASIEDR
jgi:hypothetical protein